MDLSEPKSKPAPSPDVAASDEEMVIQRLADEIYSCGDMGKIVSALESAYALGAGDYRAGREEMAAEVDALRAESVALRGELKIQDEANEILSRQLSEALVAAERGAK